jgi:hypothetical protein
MARYLDGGQVQIGITSPLKNKRRGFHHGAVLADSP